MRSPGTSVLKSPIADSARRNLEAVEFATLAWVDWFNTRRLLSQLNRKPRCSGM